MTRWPRITYESSMNEFVSKHIYRIIEYHIHLQKWIYVRLRKIWIDTSVAYLRSINYSIDSISFTILPKPLINTLPYICQLIAKITNAHTLIALKCIFPTSQAHQQYVDCVNLLSWLRSIDSISCTYKFYDKFLMFFTRWRWLLIASRIY